MEHPMYKEVIVTSDSSNITWNCCVWDPSTGSTITTFKEGNSCSRGLSLLGKDYIVSALKDKPVLKVWTWRKTDRVEQKLFVPGVVSALALSPGGHRCVASIGQKIYIWEVSSGDLISVIDFHHQEVKCIKFTHDGFYFISGGKDTLVLVWRLSEVIVSCNGVTKVAKPLYSWAHHSADVTDIHVGYGGLRSRVATVSLDQTCRVYTLTSGQLLFTVYVYDPLCSVVMDAAEYFLSLGTHSGAIFQVKWYSCLQGQSLSLTEAPTEDVFIGHSGPVTCLSSSVDAKLLVSGSDDATVKVWDVLSKICMVTIKHFAPITNAFFTMASSSLFTPEKTSPSIVVKPFERTLAKSYYEKPVEVKLRSCRLSTFKNQESDTFDKMAAKGYSCVGEQCKTELQSGIDKMLSTNHQLYSFSMNNFLNTMKDFRTFDQ